MTYEEIKQAIIARCSFRSRSVSESYKLGKIDGMLLGFQIAGEITEAVARQMKEDILYEL